MTLPRKDLIDQLPTWADGKPTFRIIFTRGEDRSFEMGMMFTNEFEAFIHAEWLVTHRLVYSAWVFADITGHIRLTPEQRKAADAYIEATT